MQTNKDNQEFINSNKIKEAMIVYSKSTEIPIFLIDRYGNEIFSTSRHEGFCNFLRDNLEEKSPCSQAHLYASKQAEQLGEAYIFTCPSGFIHFTAPLLQKGLLVGAIIAGPFLMDYGDDLLVDGIIQKFSFPLSHRSSIWRHINNTPVIEPSKVTYLSKLLFMVCSNLMEADKYALSERQDKFIQQSQINESIQSLKKEDIDATYPYQIEKELLLKVKNGDVIGAKTVLNDLLGHILFSSGGNIESIKVRIQELCVLLSRAAVEGGAVLEKIFGINNSIMDELNKAENIQDISYWTVEVLTKFTENVFNFSESKNAEVIKKAINYINEHYKDNISLDLVASTVHLNSSYFSTIFKKEVSTSFSNYLNKVRIEESKQLLKDMNNSILDIALETGFEDQSYYSKVFKKVTGKTPKEYRDRPF